MARRGIVYVTWGEAIESSLARSIESARRHHPELPIHVERFDASATLLDKPRLFDVTPFDETLFLDADTVVLDRLDFGFEKATSFGLACCINECPWARRYVGLSGDLIEYNTGVLFFTRSAEPIFRRWQAGVRTLASSMRLVTRTGHIAVSRPNDQAAFAEAVQELRASPFVLPLNWNFRPKWHATWFGPIKIWHDYNDPSPSFITRNQEQLSADAVIKFARLREQG